MAALGVAGCSEPRSGPARSFRPAWPRRYHERHIGSFERHFALPEGVDADKIEASFKNGVLTVRLPKKAEAIKLEKKIQVKTG